MLLQSSSATKNERVNADLCIIGAGPAGLAVASQFLETTTSVCLLESGELEAAQHPDALYGIESAHMTVQPESRIRTFGGTTAVWAGRWKQFDAIDFERRDWIPHSGWPVTAADLAPYYRRAAQWADAPTSEVDRGNLLDSDVLQPIPFWSQPDEALHWGKTHREQLEQAPNITVYLGAHAVLVQERGGGCDIRVRSRENEWTVHARVLVLATGGIETPRLLLLSGMGNDVVGRYYMDHPKGKTGMVETYQPFGIIDWWKVPHEGGVYSVGLRLKDHVQRQNHLLNSHVLLQPLNPRGRLARMRNLISPHKHTRLLQVRTYLEQMPRADSRVVLSSTTKDAYGNPQPRVEWCVHADDLRTAQAFHAILRDELQRLRIGEFDSPLLNGPDGLSCFADASHHMGTTRMGNDPATSAVDIDCKVRGTQYVYVAGSSVFPTSGYANPTAAIVALAIRLADHLKATL